MSTIKLVSWNVNGIRAVSKKGFHQWLDAEQPDVLCLQETKAKLEQLELTLTEREHYPVMNYNSAQRPGYSGVATWCSATAKPTSISHGTGNIAFDSKYDIEGRVIQSHHKLGSLDFILYNIYFPNGGASDERLKFKLEFYDDLLEILRKQLKTQPNIIITGDFNTAHHEIDLARPKENIETSGFMPIERERLDSLEKLGFRDAYRHFNPDLADKYTWWSFRTAARARNVGWRIDYFYVTEPLVKHLVSAEQLDSVEGSDHCPVSIIINA